jgi:hypothetical protein
MSTDDKCELCEKQAIVIAQLKIEDLGNVPGMFFEIEVKRTLCRKCLVQVLRGYADMIEFPLQ